MVLCGQLVQNNLGTMTLLFWFFHIAYFFNSIHLFSAAFSWSRHRGCRSKRKTKHPSPQQPSPAPNIIYEADSELADTCFKNFVFFTTYWSNVLVTADKALICCFISCFFLPSLVNKTSRHLNCVASFTALKEHATVLDLFSNDCWNSEICAFTVFGN